MGSRKCGIPGCQNDGENRGLNIPICEDCYKTEIPQCPKCNSGKMIDDSRVGGMQCNACSHVEYN